VKNILYHFIAHPRFVSCPVSPAAPPLHLSAFHQAANHLLSANQYLAAFQCFTTFRSLGRDGGLGAFRGLDRNRGLAAFRGLSRNGGLTAFRGLDRNEGLAAFQGFDRNATTTLAYNEGLGIEYR